MASIGRRRLEKRIQTLVSQVLVRGLSDPRIGFLTVTRVELSPDFREAKVLVSVMGEPADRTKSLRGLADARGHVREIVAKHLDLRHAPEIRFELDTSVDKSLRLARIFKDLEKERLATEASASEAEAGAPEDDAPE